MPDSIVVALGTRPEAIKLAPVIDALRRRPSLNVRTVVTGQHRDMVRSVLAAFDITPDHDLDIMREDQSPNDVLRRTVGGIEPILRDEGCRLLIVQGDTTSALGAALAAFNMKVPVGHVEAGLRSGRSDDPFPEEMNRQLISRLASIHFAPTEGNRQNLIAERIDTFSIHVTGNTVVDALDHIVGIEEEPTEVGLGNVLDEIGEDWLILLTTHRRENFGEPQRAIFEGINQLIAVRPDVHIIFPVHPNPSVRAAAEQILLKDPRLHLIEPLDYVQFIRLMSRADIALTDSGGIQEEGPALGLPVLVMRHTTERIEAIEAGGVRLIGTAADDIVREVSHLLDDQPGYEEMARKRFPFGGPGGAEKIAMIVERLHNSSAK